MTAAGAAGCACLSQVSRSMTGQADAAYESETRTSRTGWNHTRPPCSSLLPPPPCLSFLLLALVVVSCVCAAAGWAQVGEPFLSLFHACAPLLGGRRWVNRDDSPVVERLFRRVADLLGLDQEILTPGRNAELLQVVHYGKRKSAGVSVCVCGGGSGCSSGVAAAHISFL